MAFDTPLEEERAAAHLQAPSTWFGWLVDGMSGIGSIIIVMVMALVCGDVISRNMANQPITGVTELVALSIITIMFLQLASALRHGRLSRAEIFIDRFRAAFPRAGAALQSLLYLSGAVFTAVIFWATMSLFTKAWASNDFIGVEGVFTAPTWPVHAVVLIGSAVSTVQFLLMAWADARSALGSTLIVTAARPATTSTGAKP